MDRDRARRALELFERRGEVDRVAGDARLAAEACLARAVARHEAARLLVESALWEPAFTAAYDAYRSAADAVTISLGYRVPAVAGAHRIVCDIANVALSDVTVAFAPVTAERFRQERHASEYFDPANPVEKLEPDARWAVDLAASALIAVRGTLSDG